MAGTDLATTGGALALRPEQTHWSDEQLAVVRQISAENASKADLDLFFHQCSRLGLDPFLKQIHLVNYGGRPTVQIGIDGFRVRARRTASQAGETLAFEDTQWCGPDGAWVDVWLLDEPPHAARSVVLRDGIRFAHVVLYREYVGMRKVYEGNRWTGGWEVNDQWTKRPAHQLGKCAEAGAIRKAFPADLSGVYAPEELGERPDTVHGEIVREPAQPDVGLDHWLGLVASATTRAEVEAVWHQAAGGLDIRARAELQQACAAAVARVGTDSQPAGPQAAPPSDGAHREQLVVAVQHLLEECGWIEHADQCRLVAHLTDTDQQDDWATLPIADLATAERALNAALESGDPQGFFDQEALP